MCGDGWKQVEVPSSTRLLTHNSPAVSWHRLCSVPYSRKDIIEKSILECLV